MLEAFSLICVLYLVSPFSLLCLKYAFCFNHKSEAIRKKKYAQWESYPSSLTKKWWVIYSFYSKMGFFFLWIIINYVLSSLSGPPSQQRESVKVNGQEVRFFTPVRRSVRIERASLRYPFPLQDHDLCVNSYNDLLCEDEKERSEEQTDWEPSPSESCAPVYVYRENEALKDKVVVQLVCDDDD